MLPGILAAVPPLREAGLYGATAVTLRVAPRWASEVPPFASLPASTQPLAKTNSATGKRSFDRKID